MGLIYGSQLKKEKMKIKKGCAIIEKKKKGRELTKTVKKRKSSQIDKKSRVICQCSRYFGYTIDYYYCHVYCWIIGKEKIKTNASLKWVESS